MSRQPGAPARPWPESTLPGWPGGSGTVSSRSPAGRVADWASTRPSLLSVAHWPAGVLAVKRGVSSVTAMRTPSGHETCTLAVRTQGSSSRRAAAAPASTSSSGG